MKRYSLWLIVLVLVLALVGPVMAQDDALLIWADAERAPILSDLGEEFEAEFGVPVEVQEIGLGDARDQLLVAGPVGEGPDIMIIAHDSIGVLVENGAIIPMELGDLEDEFLSSALELFRFNNELWGMPYAMENIALIRNTDLVPDAPETWGDVREFSEQLQESSDAQYGFLVQTGDTYHHFPIISAFGGYIFGRNDDGTFNTADLGWASEGGIQAAQWLGNMYEDGLMAPDFGDDEIFALFEEGELGMFVTGPWFSQRIIDTGVNYAIDPLPGAEGVSETGAPFSGGQGFVISAFSEKQLLAEQFLFDFVATDDTMQELFETGGRIPTWKNVDTSDDPNISDFIEAGRNAIPMPAIPEMGAVWAAAGDSLTLVSQGEDPVATFENAQQQIASAIEVVQAGELVVGLPGSHQAAVGCDSDWDPACEATFFESQGSGMFTLTLDIPAGDYEYKVAMNAGWDENYGADGERDGANIALSLEEDSTVTFLYNHNNNMVTHVVGTDAIIGLPGSHQAAVGCAEDWDPTCPATFFTKDGENTYTLTLEIPAGDYEYKIAYNGSWDENYGVDGERDGGNYTLSLDSDATVTFTYDSETHIVSHDG